jgi:hypothetical protein
MKKKLSFMILLTILSSHLFAQQYKTSLGVRLGASNGITYKQFLSPNRAFELTGNVQFVDGDTYVGLSGVYLWTWGLANGLSCYVGPGGSVGTWSGDDSGFNFALNGMIGLEYKFNIPLAVGIDFNPHFYFLKDVGFTSLISSLGAHFTIRR